MKIRNLLTTSLILTSGTVFAETYVCESCGVGTYKTSSMQNCQACKADTTTVIGPQNPECGYKIKKVTKYCQSIGSDSNIANPQTSQEMEFVGSCSPDKICDGGVCKQMREPTQVIEEPKQYAYMCNGVERNTNRNSTIMPYCHISCNYVELPVSFEYKAFDHSKTSEYAVNFISTKDQTLFFETRNCSIIKDYTTDFYDCSSGTCKLK